MEELDPASVGSYDVGHLVNGLEELGDRTLLSLTGRALPSGDTSMIRRCIAAWNTPLRSLSWEQVRLLLGQGLGIPWTSTLALGLLRRTPDVLVTFYPGDLAMQVLRHFSLIFSADPEGARAFLRHDFAWIDVQADGNPDDEDGLVAEARSALANARLLTG